MKDGVELPLSAEDAEATQKRKEEQRLENLRLEKEAEEAKVAADRKKKAEEAKRAAQKKKEKQEKARLKLKKEKALRERREKAQKLIKGDICKL